MHFAREEPVVALDYETVLVFLGTEVGLGLARMTRVVGPGVDAALRVYNGSDEVVGGVFGGSQIVPDIVGTVGAGDGERVREPGRNGQAVFGLVE